MVNNYCIFGSSTNYKDKVVTLNSAFVNINACDINIRYPLRQCPRIATVN